MQTPATPVLPSRRRFWCVLTLAGLTAVGWLGAFVAAVIDEFGLVDVSVGWVALAMSPVLPLVWLGRGLPEEVAEVEEVQIDAVGVRRVYGGRVIEAVSWSRLVWVGIATTSEGPWAEDFIWLLGADDGTGCGVGGADACRVGLLERLQRLPGFDNRAVAEASGCAEDRRFSCWKGAAGDGVVCAAAREA